MIKNKFSKFIAIILSILLTGIFTTGVVFAESLFADLLEVDGVKVVNLGEYNPGENISKDIKIYVSSQKAFTPAISVTATTTGIEGFSASMVSITNGGLDNRQTSTVSGKAPMKPGSYSFSVTWKTKNINFNGDSDDTVIFNFTVKANISKPVLSMPNDIVGVEATGQDGAVVNFAVNANDENGDVPVFCSKSSGSVFPLGTTTVTCSATNSAGTVTGSFMVTVVDTTKPEFTSLPTNKTVEATAVNTPKADVDFGTVTASDIFGATVTNNAPDAFPYGSTTVTWTATDGNGLTSTAIQVINIVDTTAPVFTYVPASKTVKATGITTPIDIGMAAATDIFGVTITNDAPSVFPIGKTTITWTATDGHGLTSTATQVIIVEYNFSGFFSPISISSVNNVKAGSSIPVKFSLGGYMGMNIFDGSPSLAVGPNTAATYVPLDAPGASGLTYDTITGQYTYVWKTAKTLTGPVTLIIKFKDGTTKTANFMFK